MVCSQARNQITGTGKQSAGILVKIRILFSRLAIGCCIGAGLLVLAGCGYRFGSSGVLPGDVSRLQIAMFENRSAEMGLENLITGALTHEFRMRRKSVLAVDADADGVLKGVITAVRVDTISHQGLAAGGEQRIHVALDATLTDANGITVWSIRHLTESEAFRAGFDPEVNRVYQEEALHRLSRRLAETLYGNLTGGF